MWITILILTVVSCILGTVYLSMAVMRFRPVGSVRKNGLRRLLAFGIVAAAFAAVTLALSLLNATVVFLHALVFFLLSDLIFHFVTRITGRTFRINWRGWCALAALIVYMSAGYFLCHHVWRTEYTLYTDKQIAPVRIALLSDSHIGATFDGEGFAGHIETIRAQAPDLVLIAGDFVDESTRREDMVRACEALGGIGAKYGVWFAYGNHDKGNFNGRDFTAEDLARELESNSVHVLEDEAAYIGDLCIVGRRDAVRETRMEISELLSGVDTEKYIIVLDHVPRDYEKESRTAADLVVSGHTHGGQLIPINLIGEWLGFNDRTYGYERRGNTDFIVTSGIADWALDFKTGTKSEYVMIELRTRPAA